MKSRLLLLASAALFVVVPGRADDVTDNLDSAKSAYSAGNYSESIQALDYAGQLIRQKKSEAVVKLLPVAPSGWTADEGESESSAAGLMGGMVSAKRTYTRGESRITIQIQSDSPLLQSFGMMFSNPMLITASGAKLENIKGQKFAVTFKSGGTSGEAKTIVDNRYLLSIEGSDIKREDLLNFAKAIDYAKLTAAK
jgi:hypothetical protein